ncbi:MAG: hypothetical protein ACTHMV_13565 [Chitinophagaceae bacterium]
MSTIQFKRPEVAAKYVCKFEKDVVINAKGYTGLISNINLAGAEHMIKSKHPAIQLKPQEEVKNKPGKQAEAEVK